MTRKEYIQQQAKLYAPNDIGIQGAFEVAAEWADSHPRKGLVDILKVCEWLRVYHEDYTDKFDGDDTVYLRTSELIEDLRKAMEE